MLEILFFVSCPGRSFVIMLVTCSSYINVFMRKLTSQPDKITSECDTTKKIGDEKQYKVAMHSWFYTQRTHMHTKNKKFRSIRYGGNSVTLGRERVIKDVYMLDLWLCAEKPGPGGQMAWARSYLVSIVTLSCHSRKSRKWFFWHRNSVNLGRERVTKDVYMLDLWLCAEKPGPGGRMAWARSYLVSIVASANSL